LIEARNDKASLQVVAATDDEQWRSVLASLYEHGSALGQILVKHMCETLLQRIERECQAVVTPQWDFPQLREQGSGVDPSISPVQCLIGLQMLNATDKTVQEAIDLVEHTGAGHVVLASVFMSYDAVVEILNVGSRVEHQPRMTFVCVYFGMQPALQGESELD